MGRLVRDTDKKVFLILDNLRVHYSKKVMAWLQKHKDEIEVFYLPPYAPEYNPDELLNNDLKQGLGNRPMPRSKSDLKRNIRSHMKTLQFSKKKVSSFFSGKYTSYAA